jgi:hypothetical protein
VGKLPPVGQFPTASNMAKAKIIIVEWATFIPTRTTKPTFSTHNGRGHALNALRGAPEGILYHLENSQWVEVCRIENPDWDRNRSNKCDLCGTIANKYNWEYRWNHNPQTHLTVLCRNCDHG